MEEKVLCVYGCGEEAKFQLKNKNWCCSPSWNSCVSVRQKNSEAVKKAYVHGILDAKFKYLNSSEDSKKRQAWSKDKTKFKDARLRRRGKSKLIFEEVFCKESPYRNTSIKKWLLSEDLMEYVCSLCENKGAWNNKTLVLDLDHINGVHTDNSMSNLRFLCPNCHSQTITFRGRNLKVTKKPLSDIVVMKAILNSENTSQCLKILGLIPEGGNYARISNLMQKHRLDFLKKT